MPREGDFELNLTKENYSKKKNRKRKETGRDSYWDKIFSKREDGEMW